MTNIGKKADSILAENSNSGLSYLITTVSKRMSFLCTKNSSTINILLPDLICWGREFSQVWAYYETFLILSRIYNSKLNHYKYVPNSMYLLV